MTRAPAWMIAGIVVVFFVLAMVFSNFKMFSPGTAEIDRVLTLLASLAVLALLIERSVQVLRTVYLDEEIIKDSASKFGVSVNEFVALLQSPVGQAGLTLEEKNRAQRILKEETATKTTLAALIMSLGVALVGVRLLATFIPDGSLSACIVQGSDDWEKYFNAFKDAINQTLQQASQAEKEQFIAIFNAVCSSETWQRRLFGALDVILTGALVAGGSNLIHDLIERIRTRPQQQER